MNAGLLGCCQDPVNQLFVMKRYSEEGRRPEGVGGGALSKFFEKKKKKLTSRSPQQLQRVKCCSPVLALIS